jgi:hypothetical protein
MVCMNGQWWEMGVERNLQSPSPAGCKKYKHVLMKGMVRRTFSLPQLTLRPFLARALHADIETRPPGSGLPPPSSTRYGSDPS